MCNGWFLSSLSKMIQASMLWLSEKEAYLDFRIITSSFRWKPHVWRLISWYSLDTQSSIWKRSQSQINEWHQTWIIHSHKDATLSVYNNLILLNQVLLRSHEGSLMNERPVFSSLFMLTNSLFSHWRLYITYASFYGYPPCIFCSEISNQFGMNYVLVHPAD